MTQKELEILFNKGLFEPHEKSGFISVSSIIYPCLRKAYYTKKYGEFYDIDTAYTFYLGRAIHKMDFLKEGEMELEWEGILGRIDEYERSIEMVLEDNTIKKTSDDTKIKIRRNREILEVSTNEIKIGDEIEGDEIEI